MNNEAFGAALIAAERFLDAAKDVSTMLADAETFNGWPITGTKETGALRRASMDLTRALSNLRRPG